MLELFPTDWQARDEDDRFIITVTGKTPDGQAAVVHISFTPYFFVELPRGCGAGQAKLFVAEACTKHKALPALSRTVERVSMWGFTNGTKRQLAQLAFPTLRHMKWAARDYRRAGRETYESSVDPLLRFFHIRDIAPASWIAIKSHAPVDGEDAVSRAPLEVTTHFDQVFPAERASRPPLVLASFDLECYAAPQPNGSRKFPCSEREEDVIIQVATTFQRYGEPEPYRQLIMALGDTDPVEGVDVVCFDDEAIMINAWCDELAAEGADVLLSYNGDQVCSIEQHAQQQLPDALVDIGFDGLVVPVLIVFDLRGRGTFGGLHSDRGGTVLVRHGYDPLPEHYFSRSLTGATSTAAPRCWWTTRPATRASTCPSWAASSPAAASCRSASSTRARSATTVSPTWPHPACCSWTCSRSCVGSLRWTLTGQCLRRAEAAA